MREIAHIRATMLGRFALQQTGMKEPRMVSLAGRSGRLWTLVAYLILHRDRGIPAQELIDLLWPDGSGSNPASTLQNNASRARNAMATLGFSDTKGMIRYENGLYRWVPGTDTWLDVDVFEDLARRALETPDPEELRTLGREAADLYQGDFLPDAADELWCTDLHAYYRSLFVRLFRRLVQELMRTQEYAEAAALCAQAVHLDPLSEEFNLLLMQNLTRSHQAQQALDHYEALQKLYQESYGLTYPPPRSWRPPASPPRRNCTAAAWGRRLWRPSCWPATARAGRWPATTAPFGRSCCCTCVPCAVTPT